MKDRRKFLDIISERSDDPEAFPFYPIIEVAGDRRILVENHHGVIQYTQEKIGIQVKFGTVYICGSGLTLKHMTQIRLVITGKIEQICLVRRNVT